MNRLETRLRRLEARHGQCDDVIDWSATHPHLAGFRMTGRELDRLLRDIDGKGRGLPSERENRT